MRRAFCLQLTGLQAPETQQLLAELVQCPCIRLLASMDHVNAPLLWDRRTAARFNWAHFDTTTYAPYHAEAQEMPSLLIGRRSALVVSKSPSLCGCESSRYAPHHADAQGMSSLFIS